MKRTNGKYIYIVSGLMGESSSARFYLFLRHDFFPSSHVKWELMTRNDLVFWPLKYLIFEVCRVIISVPIGILLSSPAHEKENA